MGVMRLPYTTNVHPRDKFRLLAALRAAARLLAMFVPAFGLVVAVNAVAAIAVAEVPSSFSTAEQFAPAAPEHSPCFERHQHSCATAAAPAGHGAPLVFAPARRAAPVPEHSGAALALRLAAPPAAASIAILFRNFRE